MKLKANPSEKLTHIADFLQIPDISAMPQEKVKWLVEGLLPRRTATIITALPGTYKTWFALALANAVSEGKEFLGRATERMPVLYLDKDNPVAVISERRDILGLSSVNLRFWGNWLPDAPPLIDDDRLLEIAREHRPLIIFDFFRRFHNAEENSNKEMATVMASLRALVTAGATVVLLHHAAKSGKSVYRGSTDIHAGVDVAFSLSVDRKVSPPVITLDCFKHRFTEEFHLKLRLNVDQGGFEVISDTLADRSRKLVQMLKNLIHDKPGQSQKKLIAGLGLGELTVRNALRAGKGIHWNVRKGDRKTKLYFPI
jgi:AAA domain-containing protein